MASMIESAEPEKPSASAVWPTTSCPRSAPRVSVPPVPTKSCTPVSVSAKRSAFVSAGPPALEVITPCFRSSVPLPTTKPATEIDASAWTCRRVEAVMPSPKAGTPFAPPIACQSSRTGSSTPAAVVARLKSTAPAETPSWSSDASNPIRSAPNPVTSAPT
jgi:hypothetical protein